MTNRKMSRRLKTVIVLLALLGMGLFAGVIPFGLFTFTQQYPDFNAFLLPWLIFLWIAAIPLYWILGLVFGIAKEIEKDRSFSVKNIRYLHGVSRCFVVESIYFFAGNLTLWFLNLNYPVVVLLSLALCVFAIALAAVVSVLAQLMKKALDLREENESII